MTTTEQDTQNPSTSGAPAGAQIDADEQTTDVGSSGALEPDNGSQADKGLREARDRYRDERDAARDELTEARAHIEKLQRAEVDRLAADLSQPSDLMELGEVTLADLLDAAGDVDSAAVAQAVAALIESRPGLAKNPRQRAVDPSQGSSYGQPGRGAVGWAELLRN